MSGKGSSPRPMPNPEKFRENFDLIFGKKDDKNSSSTQRTLAQARDAKTEQIGKIEGCENS